MQELLNCDHSKIPLFSFKGIKTYALCVKNYDADTITIIFKYKDEIVKVNCRILNIDTPEIKSKNIELKKIAKNAKEYVSSLILNKIIYVEFLDNDKYGRPLIIVYDKDKTYNLSDKLIQGGYAYIYEGKRKLTELEQLNMLKK